MWEGSSSRRRDRKERNVLLSKEEIVEAIIGEVPDLSSGELGIPIKERFARIMDRPRQQIANEFRDQQVATLVQHNLFAMMSTTTNCSTALPRGNGLSSAYARVCCAQISRKGKRLNFAEKLSPRASYAPGAYHGKRVSRPDSVGVSIPWRCEFGKRRQRRSESHRGDGTANESAQEDDIERRLLDEPARVNIDCVTVTRKTLEANFFH
jgi:hypothetical protein